MPEPELSNNEASDHPSESNLTETYLTSKEAAKRMGISRQRVIYLCRKKKLPGVKKEGREYRIPQTAVDNWIKQNPPAQSQQIAQKPGPPEWWMRFRYTPVIWYTASAFGIIFFIVGGIFAIAEFGANVPDAIQTARKSGLIPFRYAFDPAVEGEALIVILPFYITSPGSSNVHNLIHSAVEKAIQELGREDVRVEIDPNVVLELSDREKAQGLGGDYNAAVVIWGAETRTSITVNFLNIREPQASAADEQVQILAPDTLVGATFVEWHLPEQLIFLSFFAVGQAVIANDDFTEAIRIMETAVANISEDLITEDLASPDSAAAAYFWLGWLYSSSPTQNYQQSIEAYEKSLTFNTTDYEDEALGNLGATYSLLGQYETAIDYLEQSLLIAREIGDRASEGAALRALGVAYSSLGQYETAIDYLEQSLPIAREIGNRESEEATLSALGVAYGSLGQYETAIDYLEQSLAILEETKLPGAEEIQRIQRLLDVLKQANDGN